MFKRVRIAPAMASADGNRTLVEVDPNGSHGMALALAPAKPRWSANHRLAFLVQCCVDSCNPYTKRGQKATQSAYVCLMSALRRHPNGQFDGFKLSLDSVRRRLTDALDEQAKRNKEARAATGRGGSNVQTDEEDLAQRLLELREEKEAEKDALREGRVARTTKLNLEGRENTASQMETHKKGKRRSSNSLGSPYSVPRRALGDKWKTTKDKMQRVMQSAVEIRLRAEAGKEWMRKYSLFKSEPEKWPDPGPDDAYVKKALEEYRNSLGFSVEGDEFDTPNSTDMEDDDALPRI